MKKYIILLPLLVLASCGNNEELNSPTDDSELVDTEKNEQIDYTADDFAIDSSYSCEGDTGESCQNSEILNGY